MELTNEFRVAVPPEVAWGVLTDVERIAPCLPGAQLLEVEGDEYRGTVKVKVGPITVTYKGAATFVERDESGRRAVLRAEGREARGQGTAKATITADLSPDGDGTNVSIVTDLAVTGRVAQFGRGVLADVSAKLLGQFVTCLEETVLSDSALRVAEADRARREQAAPAPAEEDAKAGQPAPSSIEAEGWEPITVSAEVVSPGSSGDGAVRRVDGPEAQPVDLFQTAGAPVAKRFAPWAGVLVVLLWLRRRRRKRRRARA
jgi:hypothetical protein